MAVLVGGAGEKARRWLETVLNIEDGRDRAELSAILPPIV